MTTDTGGQLRADARRNRAQIIAAAKQVFGDRGVEVPMEEIARAASVGVGTLYRRFPDRDALIRAVAQDNFGTALARVQDAVDEEPTAWDALVRIVHRALDMRLTTQLLSTSPTARKVVKSDPVVVEQLRDILERLEQVMSAAQDEGALRSDVGVGDIMVLYSSVMSRSLHLAEGAAQTATDRCLAIVLDGLRANAGTALPGRPLTRAEVGPDL